MSDPIIKEVQVAADPRRAFKVFTQDIGKWWPLDSHSVSANSGKTPRHLTMGAAIGEPITETTHDGGTSVWGTITDWKDGEILGFTWHPGKPETEQTMVCVRFEATEDGTLVRLTHSGWDALGTDASALRKNYESGWDMVLGSRFAGAVTG